uniref:hypothetical protein n=1 Tax=Microbacterium proteolyticum TaxID=1572644 RepID=UPI002417194D|nr:hypothetical protein [Microbacterium proteolyticum]
MAHDDDERADTPDERGTLILRDPVHDYFVLPAQLEGLLGQWPVHRLRRIAQTSLASIQYPSLTGTRFEHSLGAMHLARLAWREIWSRVDDVDDPDGFVAAVRKDLISKPPVGGKQLDKYTEEWVANESVFKKKFERSVSFALAAAGLLHDLGHPPFSHALESFFARHMGVLIETKSTLEELRTEAALGVSAQFHEIAGLHLVKSLNWSAATEISRELVLRILIGGPADSWVSVLHEIISGEIDVDRIDYIVRDANRAGTEFGAVDSTRLLQSLKLRAVGSASPEGEAAWRVGYEYRGRSAIETFLTNRMRYYQWVLFHYRVVAANKFLEEALEEIVRVENATPTNANDANISALFRRLRPNLSYFGGPKKRMYPIKTAESKGAAGIHNASDSDAIRTAAEVDDSVVTVWLKEAARRARAIRESKIHTTHSRRLAKFESLYGAIAFREQGWLSLWEDEADFVSAAEGLRLSLLPILEDTGKTLEDIRDAQGDADADETSELNLEIMNLSAIQLKMEDDAGKGLNRLAKRLLHDVPNSGGDGEDAGGVGTQPWHEVARLPSFELRKRAERRLQDRLAETPLQPGGTIVEWVVSFQSTTAVKEDADAVAIFKGNRTERISDFSAMAKGLNDLTARYPQLFVFAVLPAGSSGDLEALRLPAIEHFLSVFPNWVHNEFNLLAIGTYLE